MSNIPLSFNTHLLYAHAHFPDFQLLTVVFFKKRFLSTFPIALISCNVMLSLHVVNLQAMWITMRLVTTGTLGLLFRFLDGDECFFSLFHAEHLFTR